jgi:hypothetical protein
MKVLALQENAIVRALMLKIVKISIAGIHVASVLAFARQTALLKAVPVALTRRHLCFKNPQLFK